MTVLLTISMLRAQAAGAIRSTTPEGRRQEAWTYDEEMQLNYFYSVLFITTTLIIQCSILIYYYLHWT